MRGFHSGRVFISYRRQETAWPARQLYELLTQEFGEDQIFKDVDDIDPGDDFVEVLTEAVGSCDVLLALIGTQWLNATDDEGHRRLDDPDDFVRIEVATALRRPDVRVIPVLVDAATMPPVQELPDDLKLLVRRQAVQLNAITFDATRLLRAVHATLADIYGRPSPWLRRPVIVSTLAAGGVLVAVLGAFQLGPGRDPPSDGSSGSSSPSPSRSTTSAGGDGPDVLAHRGGWEEYPLESLRALSSAAGHGYAVETDVRWTSDDVAVIVHDERASKGLMCEPPHLVSQTTWDVLREDCKSIPSQQNPEQYPIATYRAAMEELASIGAWVYVEVKVDQTPEQEQEFIDVIRNNGLSERTVVTSFNPDYLQAIHAAAPDLRLMRFTTERLPASTLEDDQLWGVAVSSKIATKGYVRELQDAGLTVIYFLPNEAAAWATARSVGADKVMTDNPMAYSDWLAQE